MIDTFPDFRGRNIYVEAEKVLSKLFFFIRVSQLYPLLFDLIIPATLGARGGVNVFNAVDKWGLHSEVVQSESINDLSEYLRKHDTTIGPEDLKAFSPYFSDDYCLVITWMKSVEELMNEFENLNDARFGLSNKKWPVLYVEFDSKKPFYPMIPTASYGETTIPVKLFVVGLKDIECDPHFKKFIRKTFYTLPDFSNKSIFTKSIGENENYYTLFKINTQAKNFTSDLWFKPTIPSNFNLISSILKMDRSSFVFVSVLLLLMGFFSYLSGGFAGLLLFNRWRGFARFGLWNYLTLIGLNYAIKYKKDPLGETLRKTFTRTEMESTFKFVIALTFHIIFLAFLSPLLSLPFIFIEALLPKTYGLIYLSATLLIFIFLIIFKKRFSFVTIFSVIFVLLSIVFHVYLLLFLN